MYPLYSVQSVSFVVVIHTAVLTVQNDTDTQYNKTATLRSQS